MSLLLVVIVVAFVFTIGAAPGLTQKEKGLGEHDYYGVDFSPNSKERREADAGVECIGCGVCYAACDVVNWNKDYLGPAALNRAWTLVNDVRDADRDAHIAAVSADAGCHACHTHGNCANHCPKGINPTASIAGLKRAAFGAALRGKL